MPQFQSRYPPKIDFSDLPQVTDLLRVFDHITFNSDAEMLAVLETELPLIGPCVVSYYVREDHIQVRRKVDDKAILSDTLGGVTTKKDLLFGINDYFKKEMAKA